jgi:hypothetical protein
MIGRMIAGLFTLAALLVLAPQLRAAAVNPSLSVCIADDLIQPIGSRPDAVRPFIVDEIAKWGDVVRRSGARIE